MPQQDVRWGRRILTGAPADRLVRIHSRIAEACVRAGRDPQSVQLVAVSKNRPDIDTLALFHAGQRSFAESRVQAARDKIPTLPRGIEWHLIGQLQTNKAKYLPGLVTWVQSVDRIDVADALEKSFSKAQLTVNVLLEVNSGEAQKGGVSHADTEALARHVLSLQHLQLRGLMTMAPYSEDPETARPAFRRLRELAADLRASTGASLEHLSMGMTNDFEVGIEEGATMVRIGTALYEEE